MIELDGREFKSVRALSRYLEAKHREAEISTAYRIGVEVGAGMQRDLEYHRGLRDAFAAMHPRSCPVEAIAFVARLTRQGVPGDLSPTLAPRKEVP